MKEEELMIPLIEREREREREREPIRQSFQPGCELSKFGGYFSKLSQVTGESV